jgi:hypothetical protein
MRKGLFVVGLVLLIIGIAAAGLTFQQSQSVSVPQSPNASVVTLGSVTDGSMTFSWSGGSSTTWVNVSECADSSCSSFTSTVAAGHGASGSSTFSVGGGDTDEIYTNSPGVTGTVQIDGFVILTFIGIVLAGLGAFLLIVGVLARPKMRAAPAEVATPAEAAGAPDTPAVGASAAEGPGFTMPAPAAAAQQTAPGQMVKCASCGTLNEMWLHNCRWCKRPLMGTSGDAATG